MRSTIQLCTKIQQSGKPIYHTDVFSLSYASCILLMSLFTNYSDKHFHLTSWRSIYKLKVDRGSESEKGGSGVMRYRVETGTVCQCMKMKQLLTCDSLSPAGNAKTKIGRTLIRRDPQTTPKTASPSRSTLLSWQTLATLNLASLSHSSKEVSHRGEISSSAMREYTVSSGTHSNNTSITRKQAHLCIQFITNSVSLSLLRRLDSCIWD